VRIVSEQRGGAEQGRMRIQPDYPSRFLRLHCFRHRASLCTGANGGRRPRCIQASGVLSPTWVRSAGAQTQMRGVAPCPSSSVSRVATSRFLTVTHWSVRCPRRTLFAIHSSNA
jgi:hypothetical protein